MFSLSRIVFPHLLCVLYMRQIKGGALTAENHGTNDDLHDPGENKHEGPEVCTAYHSIFWSHRLLGRKINGPAERRNLYGHLSSKMKRWGGQEGTKAGGSDVGMRINSTVQSFDLEVVCCRPVASVC